MAEHEQRVADVMSRNVTTIGRNDTLERADALMTQSQLRHLPVVDGGAVIGVISEKDLLRSTVAAAMGYGERGRKALLRTLLVKEVMSEPAVTIAPQIAARDAAEIMLHRRIGCLPVVEGGALVGLVTQTDLLRAFVDR